MNCTHSSLYADSQLAVSQNRVFTPRKVICHYDHSKDKIIKSARRIKGVFDAYCIMFKEKMGGGEQIPFQCFWKEKKNTKNTKTLFWGTSRIRKYSLFVGTWNLTPRQARDELTTSWHSTPVTDMFGVPHYRSVGEIVAVSRRSELLAPSYPQKSF
jgi:hypothetical protein